MLGLRAGTVRVCPYTLEWARLFEEEATRIRAAIGADIVTIVSGIMARVPWRRCWCERRVYQNSGLHD